MATESGRRPHDAGDPEGRANRKVQIGVAVLGTATAIVVALIGLYGPGNDDSEGDPSDSLGSTTTTQAEEQELTGSITSPADGDSVAYPITLIGRLEGELGDREVFAIVRQERGGAYKLVDSCDVSGGTDVRCTELYLGAPEAHGIDFDLYLVTADDNAQQAFDEAGPAGRNDLPTGIHSLEQITVTRE